MPEALRVQMLQAIGEANRRNRLRHCGVAHRHAPAQPHFGPQPQVFIDSVFWQPQLQSDPGHWVQRQFVALTSFMRVLLVGW